MVGARLRQGGPSASDASVREVQCAGAFIMIGSDPNTKFLRGSAVQLDEKGLVVLAGRSTQSSVPGVFAAGEVADASYRQAITAAADGVKAAIDAQRWLSASFASVTRSVRRTPLSVQPTRPAPTKSPQEADPQLCDLTSAECVKRTVASRFVVVFSKSYCPFCKMALETLAAEGLRHR
eukprot:TRINITY_DN55674_c0_g1_i1.p1 TRINITY_DN55674_c0_g1~~TRINITY_DN55674_c0_g1_i1.p1  ORF type:complete len:188 (-),score=19.93 TRINITY_DN55674_c0_g1_i1:661-1197(-)